MNPDLPPEKQNRKSLPDVTTEKDVFNPEKDVFNPEKDVFNPEKDAFNPEKVVLTQPTGQNSYGTGADTESETEAYLVIGGPSKAPKFIGEEDRGWCYNCFCADRPSLSGPA